MVEIPSTQSGLAPALRPGSRRLVGAAARHFWQLLLLWLGRARQRHALGELEGHLLRDIGLTRRQALRESRKPFWRP